MSSTEKLRREDRGFLQSRFVWTPIGYMRLLKMRLQVARSAVKMPNEVKCRVYSGIGGVGAMLPAGMFLVWSCHNACQNRVRSKWDSFLTILVEHTEAYTAYIALQLGIRFLQSMRFSGVRTISSAKSTNFSFKRAYVRKLRTFSTLIIHN